MSIENRLNLLVGGCGGWSISDVVAYIAKELNVSYDTVRRATVTWGKMRGIIFDL